MNREKFKEFRHHVILAAEVACMPVHKDGEMQAFFDAIPLYQHASTSRELHGVTMAYRTFREAVGAACALPLSELRNGNNGKVRRIGR